MPQRISDLRVEQAQRHGRVVGLSRDVSETIAYAADLLASTVEWQDLAFLFDDMQQLPGGDWSIPLDRNWAIGFKWMPGVGPVEIRLIP